MSDDQHHEIRDLLVRTHAPEMHFDLDEAVRQGKRVRSRRRLAVAGGALAAISAAAIAFAGLTPGLDNEALPAGPSPAASRPHADGMAELLNGRFAIKVVAEMDSRAARLYSLTGSRSQQVFDLEIRPDRISLDVASAEEGLMVGVAPAGAVSTHFSTSGESGGFSSTATPIPGTDYQAVVLDFEKPFTQPEMPKGLWIDAEGQVYDVDGSKAPSVTLPGTKDHVFFTHLTRQIGVVEPDGWYVKDFPSDWLPNMQTQFQQLGEWRTRAVVRVPMNSPQAVSLTWDGATSEAEVGILPIGDSPWAMVVATVDGRAKITSFMYQDETGEQHHSEVK